MLHKTRGIVLKTTDYGEASVIVQVFTEKLGLQTYMVKGARKPRAKVGRNMLQPLHLLDMVVYHKNTGTMQHIKELKNAPILSTLPYDVVKSSIAMFLNEVLFKAIKHQSVDENLFGFIFSGIEWLDHQTEGLANFHLVFLVQLTRYLGFYPDRYLMDEADFFDLKNGIFSRYKPDSLSYLSPPHTQNFSKLLQCNFENTAKLKLVNDERRFLLQKLLDYFALHIESFGNVRSHEVLEEVLG